jgi:ABC-type lipoprotein release transport system permease subunit
LRVRFYNDRDAVGRHFQIENRDISYTIVGVAASVQLMLISVPLLLISIGAVASVLPALRIAKIDPAETLRTE